MALLKLLDPVRRLLTSAESVESRARRLADAGRYRESIDLLAPVPAEKIDLATLRDLVRWRHAAFTPEAGRPDWPPSIPDPFPGYRGLPEIRASALTSAVLGGAILHHGCLLVRGLINPAETRNLVEVVTKALDAAQASITTDQPVSPWFAPYLLQPGDGLYEGGRKFVIEGGGVFAADAPRALADFLAFLKAHGVVPMIEEYLGERAYLSIGKSTLRRVPPDTLTGWHQDGRFLGATIRTVNCWLALSDCGDDAPGLDLFPQRQTEIVETGTKGALDWWVVGEGVVDEMSQTTPIVNPLLKAGDALLFDQMLLHRTGARPGLKRERLAIESWFFAGSTFPMKQMPLAL
jgi:hypothetical protein